MDKFRTQKSSCIIRLTEFRCRKNRPIENLSFTAFELCRNDLRETQEPADLCEFGTCSRLLPSSNNIMLANKSSSNSEETKKSHVSSEGTQDSIVLHMDSDGDLDIPRRNDKEKSEKSSQQTPASPDDASGIVFSTSQDYPTSSSSLQKKSCSRTSVNSKYDGSSKDESSSQADAPFFVANITQCTDIDHVGCQVWSSCIVLADFLHKEFSRCAASDVQSRNLCTNNDKECTEIKTVMELGCGVGFLGPLYQRLFEDCTVILTDVEEEALEMCKCTQIINSAERGGVADVPGTVKIRHLDWQEIANSRSVAHFRRILLHKNFPSSNQKNTAAYGTGSKRGATPFSWTEPELDALLSGKVDIITACDVLYDFEGVDSFAHAVYRLLRLNPKSRMFLAQGDRLNIVAPWSNRPVDVFMEYFKDTYVAEIRTDGCEREESLATSEREHGVNSAEDNNSIFCEPVRVPFFDICLLSKAPRVFFPVACHCVDCKYFKFGTVQDLLQNMHFSQDESVNEELEIPSQSQNTCGKNKLVASEMLDFWKGASIKKEERSEQRPSADCDNKCYYFDAPPSCEDVFKYVHTWEIKLHNCGR